MTLSSGWVYRRQPTLPYSFSQALPIERGDELSFAPAEVSADCKLFSCLGIPAHSLQNLRQHEVRLIPVGSQPDSFAGLGLRSRQIAHRNRQARGLIRGAETLLASLFRLRGRFRGLAPRVQKGELSRAPKLIARHPGRDTRG